MNLPRPATRTAAGVKAGLGLLLRAWDRVAIYLPLLLMGLLALATYWMVRITPQLLEASEPRVPAHEVDFFMRGAVMKTYDQDGRLQHRLAGQEMRHYGDNATVEVDRPHWWSQAPDGRVTRANARQALSKDDGSELQLLGDAVVVRESRTPAQAGSVPRQEFHGEFLHIFADDERMKSHLPVQFFSGNDEYSGDSFSYDHQQQVVEFRGRVQARIAPDSAKK